MKFIKEIEQMPLWKAALFGMMLGAATALIILAIYHLILLAMNPKASVPNPLAVGINATTTIAAIAVQNGISTQNGITQSQPNSGASIDILTKTINFTNQTISYSQWIGEYLTNGGFIQIGYVQEQTGIYWVDSCNQSLGSINLTSNEPIAFYEYFPDASNYSCIVLSKPLQNNSINTYSFNQQNGNWGFYLNGLDIGNMQSTNQSSGIIYEHSELNSNAPNPGLTFNQSDFTNLYVYG
jgi:hypothetical protein